LQNGAVRADVIFPIPFQKPPSGLRNAYTVTMEPFLTSVTADHKSVVVRLSADAVQGIGVINLTFRLRFAYVAGAFIFSFLNHCPL
jgi:hypothetical protein